MYVEGIQKVENEKGFNYVYRAIISFSRCQRKALNIGIFVYGYLTLCLLKKTVYISPDEKIETIVLSNKTYNNEH